MCLYLFSSTPTMCDCMCQLPVFIPSSSFCVRPHLSSARIQQTTPYNITRDEQRPLTFFFLFYERRFRHNIIPFLWLKVFLLSVPLPAPRVSLSCSRSSCNAEPKHRDSEREREKYTASVCVFLFVSLCDPRQLSFR